MAGVRGLLTINKRDKGSYVPGSQSIAAFSKRGSQMMQNLPPLDVLEKMEFTEELPGQNDQDVDNQREEEEVRNIFEKHDEQGNNGLTPAEFSRALTEMEMGIPAALINHLFNLIDINSNGIISFREFLDFVYAPHPLEFDENYSVKFDADDLGLTLEINPETNTVTVLKLDDALKSQILPGSEVVAFSTRKGDQIDEILLSKLLPVFEKKCQDTAGDASTLDFLKEYLDKLHRPFNIHFKMEVMEEKLGLLGQDKDWELLQNHISTMRLKQRQQTLVEPDCPRHCKHCPQPGTPFETVHLLFEDDEYSIVSFLIITFVMTLIFVSTAAYILQTVPSLRDRKEFVIIETVVSICFTIEYAVRIASCKNMWLYFWDPMNLIDFLAVIPYWIEVSFNGQGAPMLRVIRVVRLARIIRLLRNPYFRDYLQVFYTTLAQSSHAFGLIVTLIGLFIIVCASLMYVAEQGGEDDDETDFPSIPVAMYWCVVTMTTVGYGDMAPVEVIGRIVGILTMLVGLLVIALPVIIIGGSFEDVYAEFRKKIQRKARSEELELDAATKSVPYVRVEKFFTTLNDIVHRAMGYTSDRVEFFSEDEIFAFIDQGFDTQEKVVELMKAGEAGLHFFPPDIPRYKLYVLYKVFGKKYRPLLPSDPFIRIRNQLQTKTQKDPPKPTEEDSNFRLPSEFR